MNDLTAPKKAETPPCHRSLTARLIRAALGLVLAAAVWLPSLHLFYTKPAAEFHHPDGLSPKATQLAARHLQLWTDPALRQQELQKMRASNAEWDFMGRCFLVWSLANMGLRQPAAKATYLGVMDRIIDETLRLEKQEGMHFFLMPYSRAHPYEVQPARSLFLDGEIALMLAARRALEDNPAYRAPLAQRLELIIERMQQSPVLAAESYPDECWTFDHAVAIAAIKVADYVEGSDHAAFCRQWLDTARQRLLHPQTGLLISSYSRTGAPQDGPEGSTIWMVAHCLQLVDEPFARDQYQRARKELGRTMLGFGYAREWPASWKGPTDIDSGPIVPVLQISAGASGMALIGAAAFQDWDYLSSLAATLDMAAFPSRSRGGLRYCASNQVGDAAMLYAGVLGPLWEKVKAGRKP
jgi:hypothetical protein